MSTVFRCFATIFEPFLGVFSVVFVAILIAVFGDFAELKFGVIQQVFAHLKLGPFLTLFCTFSGVFRAILLSIVHHENAGIFKQKFECFQAKLRPIFESFKDEDMN